MSLKIKRDCILFNGSVTYRILSIPYRQGDVDKLNKIQRTAARFVTNNYQRKSSVTALIQGLGWTDLQTRRKNFRLTSLYKILHGLIAVPVSDLLTPADERTRGEHKKSFKHIELTPRWDKIPFCTKLYLIGITFHQLLLNPDQ